MSLQNPKLCPDGSEPCGKFGYCDYCPRETTREKQKLDKRDDRISEETTND